MQLGAGLPSILRAPPTLIQSTNIYWANIYLQINIEQNIIL